MKAWIRRNRGYVLGQLTGEETCEPFGSRFNFHLILFSKGESILSSHLTSGSVPSDVLESLGIDPVKTGVESINWQLRIL